MFILFYKLCNVFYIKQLTIYVNKITILLRGDQMKKNMYSLMLSKSLIEEIDKLAYEQNTNRSNLINQILAKHLSLSTPEMHIREIFNTLSILMANSDTFLVQNINSGSILCIKSVLAYKYKPTIKYSIELYKHNNNYLGALKIQFRTQSELLLDTLASFFEIWINLEKRNIQPLLSIKILYKTDLGRFERSLIMPEENINNDILSESINYYINMFDNVLKKYIQNPNIDFSDIENYYIELLNDCNLII